MSQLERDDVLTIPEFLRPKRELSRTMRRCIADMRQWGRIARYPGGFWNAPNAPTTYRTASYRTSTLEALVARGLVEYCAWQFSRGGTRRFPIVARAKAPAP